MRKLGDIPAARDAFFAEAKKGVENLFPVENKAARLELGNLRYGGSVPSREEERKAVVRGGTLARPLRGDLRLIDRDTGDVLGTSTRTLAHVPYLTDRGVFVYQGSDYSGSSQFQLRPGVYTRITQSGNIESPIHAKGGRGMSIAFDPQSNEFRLKVQQSNLKLYPLLKALGVEDDTLQQLWGEDLLEINKGRTDPRALSRVARKLTGESYDPDNIGDELRSILAQSRIDPEITKKATGIHTDRVTPELLTAITSKLLSISRGEERPVARDALYAQRVATPEILLRQSLERSSPELSRRLWKAYNAKNLDRIPSGVLNPAIKSLLFTSGLFQPIEEMNPLEARDKMFRITRTGRGGLSGHSTPEEARVLHPSHAGLLDFIRTTESESVGIDLRSSLNTAVDDEGNFYTRLINAQTGEDEVVPAYRLKDLTAALPGQEESSAPLAVVGGDEQRRVNKDEVDYVIPTLQEMVSPMTNLIPGLTGVFQGRSLVGAKYPLQSLPMQEKEAPLVRVEHPGGGTFEDELAEQAGALRSPVEGTVKEVDDTHITVRGKDGETRTFELYHNLPHNRKSALLQTPQVAVGQPVNPGDVLASSNYTTPEGTLALGKNLRTGFLASSETFEDAIGISESAAEKLTVEKTRPIELENTDELQPGKNRYAAEFPGRYNKKQLDTITDEGVIEEGTEVEKGDPLILAVQVPENQPYYHQLRRSGVRHQDAAVEWDEDYPGVVTDAVKTKDGFRVFVKTKAPAVTGDKLAIRAGGKGVAVVIPDEEMPRDEEGNPLDMLISSLAITSRRNPFLATEALLGKAARERGEPYEVPAHPGEGGFTQMALDELGKYDLKAKEALFDPKTGQKIPDVLTGDVYTYRLSHTAKGKSRGRSLGGYTASGIPTRGGKCYSSDTEILTKSGWKEINNVSKEDKLATLNPETNHIEYNHPSELHVYEYSGEMLHFSSRFVDLLVTPEHEMYVRRRIHDRSQPNGERYSDFQLLPASELQTNRSRIKRDANWAGVSPPPFEFSYPDETYTSHRTHDVWDHQEDVCETYLSGKPMRVLQARYKCSQDTITNVLETCGIKLRSTGFGSYIERENQSYKTVPKTEERTRASRHSPLVFDPLDFVRFLGIYLSEGSCWAGNNHYHVTIHQYSNVHPKVYAQIKELLERNGINPYCADDRLVVQCRPLYEYCTSLGGSAHAKHVPREIFELDKEYLRELLKWLIKGDGSKRGENSFRYWTTSPQLADDVQELAVKAGYTAVISVRVSEQYTHGRTFSVSIRTDKKFSEVGIYPKHISTEAYNDLVYDVTVPNHLVYVRRNGKACWSTNSGGKRISRQPLNALLSHGALGVIEDAMKLRGASNDQYWNALRLGYNPPVPEIPYVHKKLFESLKAAGIDIRQTGEKFHLAPLTDREVDEISSGPITSSAMLDRKTMRPQPSGLFDPGRTGGPGGNRWAHHPLPVEVPNPLMEKPIARLLRIRQKDVKDIVTGKENLNDKTGPSAIRDALSRIDVKRRINYLEGHLKGMNKTQRDKAIKELKHLRALNEHDISPEDLMVSKVPILPPAARPISQIAGLEQPVVSDANVLYKDLIDLSNAYREAADDLPEERLASYRGRLYDAVKAVYGLGDPVTRASREKNVKGLLKTVFGDSPKHSQFQMEVLGRPQELSGLAVISPRSDLDIDQVGLPKKLAWDVYQPFVARYLVNTGMKPTQAMTEIKEKSSKAERGLQEVVKKRPLIVNRAPTLHKFGMMAFWPVLHDGDTLQVSPATVQGYGADFDGDTALFHVPVLPNAVEDALKMLPSRNLRNPRRGETVYRPWKEFAQGIYLASRAGKGRAKTFSTPEEAIREYKRGKIPVDQKVRIA